MGNEVYQVGVIAVKVDLNSKIVYAAGVPFSGAYALSIVDLKLGTSFEFAPTAPKQDRPSPGRRTARDWPWLERRPLGQGGGSGLDCRAAHQHWGVTEERPVLKEP